MIWISLGLILHILQIDTLATFFIKFYKKIQKKENFQEMSLLEFPEGYTLNLGGISILRKKTEYLKY